MTRVLVTGGTGFVGRPLCRALLGAGFDVRVALRSPASIPEDACEPAVVGEIDSRTDWSSALRNVDVVIHAAARVHVMNDRGRGDTYVETNARGTEQLASSAARAGVGRFVYVSTIKVNGEQTLRRPFSSDDPPAPQDDYGRSKWLAEQLIARVCASAPMESVIVRPPLIYGPGVKANFLRLMRWVDAEKPIPLGAVRNSRSLVSVWNIVDLLTLAARHPGAAGRTWLVSDDEDLSTPELIRRLGAAMRRRVRLVPVPVVALQFAGWLMRRPEIARLCGSLAVDVAPTRGLLGWSPPWTVDRSLARTVEWYLSEGRLREG